MIPTPQKINNKLQGVFYPLQKEELIALRQAKLINNTALILIKSGRLLIEWINKPSSPTTENVGNQGGEYKDTGSQAELSDLTENYQIRESIIRFGKKFDQELTAMRSFCGHADAASSATCNIQLDNDIPFF